MHKRIAAMAVACSLAGVMATAALPIALPDSTAFASMATLFDSTSVNDCRYETAATQSGSSFGSVSDAILDAKLLAEGSPDLSGIVVDGKPIGTALARAIATAPQDYCSRVNYIDQYEDLPSGCEIIALAVCLNSMGFSVTPTEIADSYLDTSDADQETYLGSPYEDGGCLPPAIVQTTAAFSAGKAQKAYALDITGTSMQDLIALTNLGYPVLTWTTEGIIDPYDFEYISDEWTWYYPEHCVALYGVNGDNVLVSDSMYGLMEYDAGQFAEVYGECGSMAVVIVPENVARAGMTLSSSAASKVMPETE